QRTAMFARNVARDREPKPCSACLARARRLDAIERVEDVFHLRFGYSRAAVAHANHGLVSFTRRRHARISAVFHCVVDEVGKTSLQSDRNSEYRNARLTF